MGTATKGYSAAEWAKRAPNASWHDKQLAAHRQWGGGRELSEAEFTQWLDLLWQLQALADEVVSELMAQLPDELRAAEAAWEREMKCGGKGVEVSASPIMQWTHSCLREQPPGALSIIYSDEASMNDTTIFSNEAFVGEAFRMSISYGTAAALNRSFVALTGVLPQAFVFLQALHHYQWRTSGKLAHGQTSQTGWAVLAVTIPH